MVDGVDGSTEGAHAEIRADHATGVERLTLWIGRVEIHALQELVPYGDLATWAETFTAGWQECEQHLKELCEGEE